MKSVFWNHSQRRMRNINAHTKISKWTNTKIMKNNSNAIVHKIILWHHSTHHQNMSSCSDPNNEEKNAKHRTKATNQKVTHTDIWSPHLLVFRMIEFRHPNVIECHDNENHMKPTNTIFFKQNVKIEICIFCWISKSPSSSHPPQNWSLKLPDVDCGLVHVRDMRPTWWCLRSLRKIAERKF